MLRQAYGAEDWAYLWGTGPKEGRCYRYVYDNGCKSLSNVINALLCDMRLGKNQDLYDGFYENKHTFERACTYNRLGYLREEDGDLRVCAAL